MTTQEFERLLFEDEGTALDFKRDQYPFAKASRDDKSELVKDILAFANAWRRATAYILIGVEEVKGGKSNVVGISEHLEDAHVQQLVNKKTKRPVEFSYRGIEYAGKKVGVIAIPCQARPLFLKKDFGKLKADEVYIRRGSSTEVAKPDEIAKMGRSSSSGLINTDIEILLGDPSEKNVFGNSMNLDSTRFEVEESSTLPSYGVLFGSIPEPGANTNFYREYAKFLSQIQLLSPIGFQLLNGGTIAARNARLEVNFDKSLGLEVYEHAPQKPEKSFLINIRTPFQSNSVAEGHLNVERLQDKWHLISEFPTLQPKMPRWTSEVYLGSAESLEIDLTARLYADNLESPVETDLTIKIASSATEPFTAAELIEFADTDGIQK